MVKSATKPPPSTSVQGRRLAAELRKLREQAEDLLDLVDALEVRARNIGKPRLTHAQVLRKFAVK